jgi:hypothetical protein
MRTATVSEVFSRAMPPQTSAAGFLFQLHDSAVNSWLGAPANCREGQAKAVPPGVPRRAFRGFIGQLTSTEAILAARSMPQFARLIASFDQNMITVDQNIITVLHETTHV